MPKASKPVAGKAAGGGSGKAAKKGGKSKGSGPPLGLIGAVFALVAALLAGTIFLRRGADPPKIVDVTFSNPSGKEVHLFSAPAFGSQQKLASLAPGDEFERRAAVGERFFFSPQESGATQTHALKVDANLLTYGFNPNCRDLHGRAGCARFMNSPDACMKNPGWMSVNCAASCELCHLMDPKVRCSFEALGTNATMATGPGDIGRMFEGLAERFPQYGVKLVSTEPDGPYVATFDNFVTDEESRVIRDITFPNLARSTDQGSIDPTTGVQEKVTSQGRTSRNAWCDVNSGCSSHPVVAKLMKRISEVVQVPEDNFEYMQVLQYDRGQEYNMHHDSNPLDFSKPAGPRLYTMFLYFAEVEEGGGTSFPNLNITVTPAKGKALLWPSCLDKTPNEIDHRTMHAALPVVRGRKLAANVWVHQRNYRHPNLWGCTGSFA